MAKLLVKRATLIAIVFSLANFTQATPSDEAARANNLGAAYMNQQLFEKARKSFEHASQLNPELTIARMNEGIALLNLVEVDEAAKILEESVKQNPNDPHAWYNLGLLYKNTSDPSRAVDAFKRVITIDANDPDTWYFLGSVYSQLKQFPNAIDSFQHALAINPLHASSQFGLARAYQQAGDVAQARERLARFQYITQNKLGAAITLAYGEQGKYSLVEESAEGVEKVPPAIDVRFEDVTGATGLTSKAGPRDVAGYFGPGACFFDYDGDGYPDLFLADNGPQGGMTLYHNLRDGQFEDVTKKAGLDPTMHAIGCTAGDYDNDGATDLAVSFNGHVMLLRNEKNGTFKDVTEAAGIKNPGFNTGLTFIDYDHDGDLDLFVSQSDTATMYRSTAPADQNSFGRMWRNNGNGTFTDVTEAIGMSSTLPGLGAIGTDFNNDRAVDLIPTGNRTEYQYLKNPREGKFTAEPLQAGVPPTSGVAVLDFNHDGWMDVAFTHNTSPALTLSSNQHGTKLEPVALPETGWTRAYGVAAFDYDNDGWVDLVAVGETKDGRGQVKLFRNLGPDGFKDVTAETGLDKISLKDPRGVATADYDDDGTTDLLITQNHGPAVLLKNVGANKNHWLRLSLKGLNDNKSAIGTKVEVFSGANRQKFELAGSSGYLGQNSLDIVIGLGEEKQADIVRMLWPTGVLEDEIEVAGDRPISYTELDRRGSSCPTLFAWDGHSYKLVGDMLGAGVVGHWIAPGERDIPRPVEYIKLDQELPLKDGRLSMRFMEPLEEAVYLDNVELLAVDHPENVDVYPNEYFASNPPYPPFKVVVSENAKPPAGAWDEHGHDVLPALLKHQYFGDFKVLPFLGFAESHSLEIDLGDPYRGGPLWLLLDGEIEYYSATSMYAADQAGLRPVSPYVEALGKDGKWTRVIDDMGFPAGGVRTMTADFTDKLPIGTKRIRITTTLQIYWDSILIDRASQNQPMHVASVPLAKAGLDFHGFPLKVENKPPGNVAYYYEQSSPTGPYSRPAGSYTRYGDVLPLLRANDDRIAVFGSGDEVALEFDPATLEPLPQGWKRDYFFVARGYEKDMDFYAYKFDQVDPLPFNEMNGYPYPDRAYPLDDIHLNDLLDYDTRQVSGNEAAGYEFRYPAGKKNPF